MRFRPCIDLHEGKVKQIVGSTLRDRGTPVTNFTTDRAAAEFARLYAADGLAGGHVIMLGPGNEAAACTALAAYPQGFHIGGGITPANAQSFLDAGASHVIVTSLVFSEGKVHWDLLAQMMATVGKTRLVVDVSCKKQGADYFVVTNKWQTFTPCVISSKNLERLAEYCDEFLVHAADIEGKRQGVDTALISMLAAWSPIPVTYAGGIRSIADIETVRVAGKGRVDYTIGSSLDIFGGDLKYADVVAWQRNNR